MSNYEDFVKMALLSKETKNNVDTLLKAYKESMELNERLINHLIKSKGAKYYIGRKSFNTFEEAVTHLCTIY